MLRSWTTKKLLPDGQIRCPVSELEKTLVFDWRLQGPHRQTAAVILIHHNHPVPPFVVRACSQHLYQITLMHRKNLCFCSTPDGPFNSVWDWTRINPFLVMSCTLTKLPLFRSLAYFCGSRTEMGSPAEFTLWMYWRNVFILFPHMSSDGVPNLWWLLERT